MTEKIRAAAVDAAEQACAARRHTRSRAMISIEVRTPESLPADERERIRQDVFRAVHRLSPGIPCNAVLFQVDPDVAVYRITAPDATIRPLEGTPVHYQRPGEGTLPHRPTPQLPNSAQAEDATCGGCWLHLVDARGTPSRHLLDARGWRPFGRPPRQGGAAEPEPIIIPLAMRTVPRGWLLEARWHRGTVEVRRTPERPTCAVEVDGIPVQRAGPPTTLGTGGEVIYRLAAGSAGVRYRLEAAT